MESIGHSGDLGQHPSPTSQNEERLRPFKLERYFARWEFDAPYLLCGSDVEGYEMKDLLALAGDDARLRWERLALGYTESSGLPELRAEMAALYETISPDEVLAFAGAEEAIFALMHARLDRGDHVVCTWPGYQSLYEVARSLGAEITLLRLDADHGWNADLDVLRRSIRPNTKLVVINYPHNPTGALLSHEDFRAIVEMTEDAGITLFSDEVYRLLEYSPDDRLPAADLGRRMVSLGVMSKAFGLAGLRIGWVATHDADLLGRLAAVKDYLSICNSAPSEILALIALRAKERVLERSRSILASNLALLDGFFAKWSDELEWVRPRAGSVGFPSLRGGRRIDEFADDLVREAGVLVLPGTVYEYPGAHFRIGFGRLTMPQALAKLDEFATARWR